LKKVKTEKIHNKQPETSALYNLHVEWWGARFSTESYTRGCHWIPRMFA
jgi:hypothetical protein